MDLDLALPEADLEWLANRFKILSEPTRLQILAAICQQERKVCEICDRTGLSQANVSKHLRLLKDAGVVACRREGVSRYYRLVDRDLLDLCTKARCRNPAK
ncbi:ArsR/SmtB family transcription factor [Baaleninema simplex]|uniref:ArsR/SmtB family transcription factor n=1 Tax=Baaleninema simplex TaxID=2862350 RepID=UPI00036D309C|nr:metalloregulator ArsR/SmtB family transcription factor [Baaleninema simplex]